MLNRFFHRFIFRNLWVTFLVLGLSFFAFGAGSLNLFYVFSANTVLLRDNGWQAVMDGGLQQLLEVLATGYLSLAAYVVFKACEHHLVQTLTHSQEPAKNTVVTSTHKVGVTKKSE